LMSTMTTTSTSLGSMMIAPPSSPTATANDGDRVGRSSSDEATSTALDRIASQWHPWVTKQDIEAPVPEGHKQFLTSLWYRQPSSQSSSTQAMSTSSSSSTSISSKKSDGEQPSSPTLQPMSPPSPPRSTSGSDMPSYDDAPDWEFQHPLSKPHVTWMTHPWHKSSLDSSAQTGSSLSSKSSPSTTTTTTTGGGSTATGAGGNRRDAPALIRLPSDVVQPSRASSPLQPGVQPGMVSRASAMMVRAVGLPPIESPFEAQVDELHREPVFVHVPSDDKPSSSSPSQPTGRRLAKGQPGSPDPQAKRLKPSSASSSPGQPSRALHSATVTKAPASSSSSSSLTEADSRFSSSFSSLPHPNHPFR